MENTTQKITNCLLIDPTNHTVSEVRLECGNGSMDFLNAVYRLLSTDTVKVSCVDVASTLSASKKQQSIWIDDEGLLVNPDHQDYFLWDGRFLAGRALITGYDEATGANADTDLSVREIINRRILAFPDQQEARNHVRRNF